MSIFRNRKFHFSADKTITALLASLLCYSMSYWQWTRYQEKKTYFKTLERQSQKPTQQIDPTISDWEPLLHATFRGNGHFDFDREVVLINRSKDDETGVQVITPFRLGQTEKAILVNRGFLPYVDYAKKEVDGYRNANDSTIEGLIRPSQKKTFFLAPETKAPKPGSWKDRWWRLEIEKMAAQLPYPVLPVYLEQTNQSGEKPQFDAKKITKPGLHLNYTFQWIGFGSFAILLAVFLQLRPISGGVSRKEPPHKTRLKTNDSATQ